MHLLPTNLRNVFKVRHLRRSMALGLRSLWMRRLRSLLTALGIVFGACSVIAMLAIGEGASYEAQQQIKNLGSQNVILKTVKPPENTSATNTDTIYLATFGLRYKDITQIRETVPGITVVVPAHTIRDYVWSLANNVECEIKGTVPWYPSMKNLQLKSGRFFGEVEMERRANVCVLNETAAKTLLPLSSPVGKTVRVGGTYFRIIGVSKDPGSTATNPGSSNPGGSSGTQPGSANTDSENHGAEMIVPLNTLLERFGDVLYKRNGGGYYAERVELHEVTVKVDDPATVVASANAIRQILARNHSEADYSVTVPVELLRQAERTKRIFNIVLGSIAAISLVVGGIGIMNIMLANVTERTREIGIRRALGAKRSDIVLQFLIETVLLSGVGGLIGVALGLLIPVVVSHLAGMVTIIKLAGPVLAFTISVLTGIIFGIYPALRAAEMNPVEALRNE